MERSLRSLYSIASQQSFALDGDTNWLSERQLMEHPYKEHEGSLLWRALDAEIAALEQNGDVELSTARVYVLGSLCRRLVADGLAPAVVRSAPPHQPPAVERDEIAFQCAFCGKAINHDAPRTLILEVDDGGQQELPCHEECLRRALHESVPLAI